MSSGVSVSDECKLTYDRIKSKKELRFAVFCIRNGKEIDVETVGARDATYDDFLQKLKVVNNSDKECRYGLYDFEYTHKCQGTQERKKEKIFLMSWCPDESTVHKKMLYSSSFESLKKALVGVAKYIQATDDSEASAEAVEQKLRSTDRI